VITEESNREFAAQCRGCPKLEITRKPTANNTEQFWSQLRRKGWARTNYVFRDFGDTYWLWCPDCWQRVRRLPNYDNDTHRVLTKGQPMSTNETTELTPAVRAAAEAILNQIAPGQEHTSLHQNVETYAEMATAVVRAVTPEVFEEMARVVDVGPETWTREALAAELRQGARNRRAALAAEADALHMALFGQSDTAGES
jgi:hypothetical protein